MSFGIAMTFVESYHLHPKLIEALVSCQSRTQRLLILDEPVKVLFSAHSLPVKIREMNDPYEKQLLETSAAVAEGAGVKDWQFTWQSAGRTREPWLGPDILETLQEVSGEGHKQVLAAPIGFVSDHLEVLYDLDIEAQAAARAVDMKLARIQCSIPTRCTWRRLLSQSLHRMLGAASNRYPAVRDKGDEHDAERRTT